MFFVSKSRNMWFLWQRFQHVVFTKQNIQHFKNKANREMSWTSWKTPNFNRRNKIKLTALSKTTTASALNLWKYNEKDYQWDLTPDFVMVYKSRQTPRVHHDKRLIYWRDCHWRPISSENVPAVRLICASFCVNFDKRQKISGFELILTSMSGKNKIIKIYTPECWSHILRVSIFF